VVQDDKVTDFISIRSKPTRAHEATRSGSAISAVGALTLDRPAGARSGFEIQAIGANGILHVPFDNASMEPAFREAVGAMQAGKLVAARAA
jgi:hypothetical protein